MWIGGYHSPGKYQEIFTLTPTPTMNIIHKSYKIDCHPRSYLDWIDSVGYVADRGGDRRRWTGTIRSSFVVAIVAGMNPSWTIYAKTYFFKISKVYLHLSAYALILFQALKQTISDTHVAGLLSGYLHTTCLDFYSTFRLPMLASNLTADIQEFTKYYFRYEQEKLVRCIFMWGLQHRNCRPCSTSSTKRICLLSPYIPHMCLAEVCTRDSTCRTSLNDMNTPANAWSPKLSKLVLPKAMVPWTYDMLTPTGPDLIEEAVHWINSGGRFLQHACYIWSWRTNLIAFFFLVPSRNVRHDCRRGPA